MFDAEPDCLPPPPWPGWGSRSRIGATVCLDRLEAHQPDWAIPVAFDLSSTYESGQVLGGIAGPGGGLCDRDEVVAFGHPPPLREGRRECSSGAVSTLELEAW
jgi:hypothetical protein